MPVMIECTNGRFAPVLICDLCGERIADVAMASYEWDGDGQIEGERRALFLVHKQCSPAHERLRGVDHLFSMELMALLPFLAHNLRLDWKEAEVLAWLAGR